MPLITSNNSIPLMTAVIDDVYTRVVSVNSNDTRQDYVDYTLTQSVDTTRCIAVINSAIGCCYYNSGDKYTIGMLPELINSNTMRLWVGGSLFGSTRSFDMPIIIYEFGVTPKRIETIIATNNAVSVNLDVSLSSPADRSKSVIFNSAAASLTYHETDCVWKDDSHLTFNWSVGCTVVEF